MSGNLFLCFLLVNKNTKSLICILFTVAHVSRLHATCNAIACNCMQCKVQRTTLLVERAGETLSEREREREGGREVCVCVCVLNSHSVFPFFVFCVLRPLSYLVSQSVSVCFHCVHFSSPIYIY